MARDPQKRSDAARAASQRRAATEEARQLAEIDAVRHRLPDEVARVLDFIAEVIPTRSNDDRAYLQETRALHFRPFRKFLPTVMPAYTKPKVEGYNPFASQKRS